jgi:hypothetical protein
LDLDAELVSEKLVDEVSILDSKSPADASMLAFGSSREPKKERPAFWNADYEKELGDLDGDAKKKWVQEARDVLEQKRGIAIWSKKSDQEIQRQAKKLQDSKTVYIPDLVSLVVNAVFLDKTHKISDIKAQNEVAFREFRKWLRERKKKSKANPLAIAKVEVSKKWLMQAPGQSASQSARSTQLSPPKAADSPAPSFALKEDKGMPSLGGSKSNYIEVPQVVMDEYTTPLPGIILGSGQKTASPTPVNSFFKSAPPAVITPSMVNWQKSEKDLPQEYPSFKGANGAYWGKMGEKVEDRWEKLKVDDEEMFLANNCINSEYFVVL